MKTLAEFTGMRFYIDDSCELCIKALEQFKDSNVKHFTLQITPDYNVSGRITHYHLTFKNNES